MCKPELVDSIKTRETLAKWLVANGTITLNVVPDDSDPEDSFDDPDNVSFVRAGLNSGSLWAWCTVIVRITYCGAIGEDTLGGCSYESEDSFRSDAYYADMVSAAATDLVAQLMESRETLQRMWSLATLSLPDPNATK